MQTRVHFRSETDCSENSLKIPNYVRIDSKKKFRLQLHVGNVVLLLNDLIKLFCWLQFEACYKMLKLTKFRFLSKPFRVAMNKFYDSIFLSIYANMAFGEILMWRAFRVKRHCLNIIYFLVLQNPFNRISVILLQRIKSM